MIGYAAESEPYKPEPAATIERLESAVSRIEVAAGYGVERLVENLLGGAPEAAATAPPAPALHVEGLFPRMEAAAEALNALADRVDGVLERTRREFP